MTRLARALIASALLLGLGLGPVQAQSQPQPQVHSGPVGLWKTVDDETRKEKSLIRIAEDGGVLTGRIEKLLDPATPADATCEKCSDARKGEPIVGMTIMRNVRASNGDPGVWHGGDILDPNNGKVYKVRLKPVDQGARLEVRGYIGAAILGRTQTWVRVE